MHQYRSTYKIRIQFVIIRNNVSNGQPLKKDNDKRKTLVRAMIMNATGRQSTCLPLSRIIRIIIAGPSITFESRSIRSLSKLRDNIHVGGRIGRGRCQTAKGVLVRKPVLTTGLRRAQRRQMWRGEHWIAAVNRPIPVVLHQIFQLGYAQTRRLLGNQFWNLYEYTYKYKYRVARSIFFQTRVEK